MAWSILACFRPQENASDQQQIAERCPVAGFNRFNIAVNKFQFTLRQEAGGIHRKLDCPHGKILRIFKDDLRIDYDLDRCNFLQYV